MSTAGDEVHEHVDSDYDEDLAIPDESLDTKTDGEIAVRLEDKVDFQAALVAIPFQSLHDQPIKFKAPQRNLFIPKAEITVSIINYERNFTRHMLNPNLYTIQFQHGGFSWTVQRRYKDFQHLHNQLKMFRAGLNIPFPTKTHKERRASFKNYQNQNAGKSKGALPRFPSKPEALVPFEQIDRRIQQLTDYLRNLLKINLYRQHYETANFMEVSNLSFINDLGAKGKEGFIMKRSGSSQPGKKGCNCCGLFDNLICVRCCYLCSDICGTWRNRWLVCKDTWMAWIRPKDGRIRSVILFDSGFEVSSGVYTTGLHKGLVVVTLCRQVILKCSSQRQSKEWLEFLKKLSYNQAHEFIQQNRHFSFAPVRMDTHAAWFVDGSGYMAAVADAIEAAREEVYIADWWLSPEIYMKRPAMDGDHWRLDKLLARKASQGVKIFVLLYKEVELALGINSYYSKQRLVQGHHENIKVLRHPDHAKAGVFLWAHHEKVVVIDQTYAFVAGIDLCYGRWDDEVHRLTDLGSVSQVAGVYQPSKGSQTSSRPNGLSLRRSELIDVDLKPSEPEGQTRSGLDQVDDTGEVQALQPISEEDAMLSSLTPENIKCNTPEMERRRNLLEKVKMNVKSKGKEFMNMFGSSDEEEEEGDVPTSPLPTGPTPTTSPENKKKRKGPKSPKVPKSHVVQGADESVDFINTEKPDSPPPSDEKDSGIKLVPRYFFVDGLMGSAKLWYGKDYTNFIVKDFNNLHMPYQDLVDRNITPRMPWHDIGVLVQGAAARDVARHFIQRWNAVKMEKAKLNPAYPFLLPKAYSELKLAPFVPPIVNNLKLHNVDCQVLRSASSWSVGFLDSDGFEESIHAAYIDTITRARYYVYIENQFFITQANQNGKSPVLNRIGEALYNRIMRAHRERKIFRVFVVMPLLPGFEGEVGTPTGTALHAITHYNYASISRGKDSLIQRMKDAGIRDPEEYVSFNGLRKHSELNGGLVTELIYVHSKLLIADDQVVICGSANINDRSMLGKRDSEVAVIIADRDFDTSTMAHEPWTAGRFASALRKQLFKEHLGFTEDESIRWLGDPASDTFYREFWLSRADRNTAIYEEVFHCIPSDRATTFAALKKYQEEEPLCLTDRTAAERKLEEVKGHLVKLPLEFLSGEVLTPNPGSVQGMMPTALWT